MNTIGVLARADLTEASPVVQKLVAWLGERGQRACLDEATAALEAIRSHDTDVPIVVSVTPATTSFINVPVI